MRTQVRIPESTRTPPTSRVVPANCARHWTGRICRYVAFALAAGLLLPMANAQQKLQIKPLAEARVANLPAGELYWRVDNFDSMAKAKAAAGAWSLVVEAAGRTWMLTLGPEGGSSPEAVKVKEIGPIPRISAQTYLLRINDASGPPGSITPIHSHPGSEAFFVIAGEQSIRHTHGVLRVRAGQAEAGRGADQAMQVSSSGSTDLHALVMFVVDADKPFSVPATLPTP